MRRCPWASCRLIAGCLLTAIAFLLSLRLSLPWFSGPIGLLALAVIYHRREAFVPPDVRVTLSWDGLVAGLVSVVLLAPPVLAALRMAPGEFPPVFFNVDVPYFLEQVHALVGADRFPPDSLGVVDGRRAYHFGVPALAALIARGSGAEPHHVLFVILVPTFAAGILAAAVVLARAIGPTVPPPSRCLCSLSRAPAFGTNSRRRWYGHCGACGQSSPSKRLIRSARVGRCGA